MAGYRGFEKKKSKLGTTLLIGLYPRLLLDLIVPALHSPLFDGMRKGAGQ